MVEKTKELMHADLADISQGLRQTKITVNNTLCDYKSLGYGYTTGTGLEKSSQKTLGKKLVYAIIWMEVWYSKATLAIKPQID